MPVTTTQMLTLLKITFLLNFLLVGCSEKKESQKTEKKKTKTALTIIKNDDCLNCHSIEDKSVGPSYLKVAQRYESDFSTVNRLAKKVIEGGGGLWGGGQMSKHPRLKSNDARRVVRWILSLDDSVANPNPLLATPSVNLPAALQRTSADSETGLALYVYSSENSDSTTPQRTGVVKKVHFVGEDAFGELSKASTLKMTGFITIEQRGKYFFKQVRIGKGSVVLNEATIVNENDWDRETDIDLEAGTYPITVEYQLNNEHSHLSLQWITPEDEYYRVIPEEVFTINAPQNQAALLESSHSLSFLKATINR